MKKIAVFFSDTQPMGYPLSKPDYWTAYSELTEEVSLHGGELYIVRGQESYLGSGSFSNSWQINNGELVEAGPVTVSVVFNKGRFETDEKVPVFNYRDVTAVCLDKWEMYQRLKEYCPVTFFVKSREELLAILSQITTDKVVFKPYRGAEGYGVKIQDKSYFEHTADELVYPAVVSEFLDTSVGVPGIWDGYHDLRLAVFDGEILYSYLRTPPEGSLLANVAQGGTFMMIEPEKLPEDVVSITKKIDQELTGCEHRFYSVDFGYTADGPKIIEMNSELGLLPDKDHPVFHILKQKLAQSFMDLASV